MSTVSVVIPSYNRCDLLLECLQSVATQTREPDEIIIVDDGSTDGTLAALEARTDLKLVVQENAGPGAARNRGAQLATGDYIAFLDSDDVWFPWSLATMMSLVEQESASLLFGAYTDFATDAVAEHTSLQADVHRNYLSAAENGYFAGAGMMVVDRDVFLATGGFIEDRLNAEDHDLALRLGVSKGFVQILAPITIGHRIHGDNAMGDAMANWQGVERLVARERANIYPGGGAQKRARRKIISGHARAAIVSLAQAGHKEQAWRGYSSVWFWNLGLGRLKFLAAFPFLLARQLFRRRSAAKTEEG